MRIGVEISESEFQNKEFISMLRLLCILEYAIASMKWYVGEEAGRVELPPHEHVLSLALNIAIIGEALHTFNTFIEKGIIQKNDAWSSQVKEKWDLLHTEDVMQLKKNHLKIIRDKTAFHVDESTVQDALQCILKNPNGHIIWKSTTEGKEGHSPLAAKIVAYTLFKTTFDNKEIAALTSTVYGALRDVVLAVLSDNCNMYKID